MYMYMFVGVVTRKNSAELLRELRQYSNNIIAVIIHYPDNTVVVDFREEPTKEELENIKSKLNATRYEKVEQR